MRHVISASLFVLSCALAQPASAQLEDKPVPMDKAPFHIPVFSNDYLILLNVNIPPGRNTGYHIHYADSVSVNLTPASQTNQNYGSSEVSAPGTGGEGEPGRTTFTNVTKDGPRTHKATNVGPTPFHNISFILKNRGPAGTTVSDRSGITGYTQIMDNARIRAWRVVLKPGEATGQIDVILGHDYVPVLGIADLASGDVGCALLLELQIFLVGPACDEVGRLHDIPAHLGGIVLVDHVVERRVLRGRQLFAAMDQLVGVAPRERQAAEPGRNDFIAEGGSKLFGHSGSLTPR